MKRNLRLVFLLIKMKLSHMMVFRLNFFGAFFVDGSMFAIELLVFSTIYSNVDSIGGWSRGEMIIFIGTFSLINALNMVIYFFGIVKIPGKILNGELDHYLAKPMNPLLRLTFEEVNPGSIPLVPGSAAIILYGVSLLKKPVTAGAVAGYILMVLLMTLLWYDMEVILRCLPFFFSSSSAADQFEGSFLSLCFRIPGTLFKGAFKLLFYFIMPYGIMSTIPTQMLAGTLTPLGFLYGAGVVLLFTIFALKFWRFGLRHYTSASG